MNHKKIGMILVAASVAVTLLVLVVAFLRQPGKGKPVTLRGSGQVAVINLTGQIGFNQTSLLSSSSSTDQTMRALERAEKDRSIDAVVIRIDSPGGSAAASQELHAQVLRLKQAGKKVVASFGDVAASGGYYVGVAADRIVAQPATVTGSIGVIAQVPNLEELYRKIGMSEQIFKSGPHKDMMSPSRPVTPEEAQIMQGIVDDTYNQFVEAVATGRHLPQDKVRLLADGRIYTGAQARELQLIDELGGLRDAINLAAKLAGIKEEPQVIEYRTQGIFDFLNTMSLLHNLLEWSPESLLSEPLPPAYTTLQY